MTKISYHDPVLLQPSVTALITDPKGVYVDATFGGGGHSQEILNQLAPEGRLFAFDQVCCWGSIPDVTVLAADSITT